jgi:hypothetical protein
MLETRRFIAYADLIMKPREKPKPCPLGEKQVAMTRDGDFGSHVRAAEGHFAQPNARLSTRRGTRRGRIGAFFNDTLFERTWWEQSHATQSPFFLTGACDFMAASSMTAITSP